MIFIGLFPSRRVRVRLQARDKSKEELRYDERAKMRGVQSGSEQHFREIFEGPLSTPYLIYYSWIQEANSLTGDALELCAGIGEHTNILVSQFKLVVATDISSHSLKCLASRFGLSIHKASEECHPSMNLVTSVADIEALPFEDNSFDVVCCAGGLSYGDNDQVLAEIYRVIKPGGHFICVDSLDDFFVYKLNRLLHFIKGERTLSTCLNMPRMNLIKKYSQRFSGVRVAFLGKLSFLIPVFRIFLDEESIKYLLDKADMLLPNMMAFKFVLKAVK